MRNQQLVETEDSYKINHKLQEFLDTIPTKSKSIDYEFVGVKRVYIELSSKDSDEAAVLMRKYMELVLDISKVVSDQIGYKRGKKKRRSIYN
ncbi:hypothetical protein KO317_01750 [Candidatus Micrarchaeota archaeon]|jgi:hypothetical protein|nr:hypothetical protein [Candidatus Micrarchaeota archaeon]